MAPLLAPRRLARPFETGAAVREALRPAPLAVALVFTCATGFISTFEGGWVLAELLLWSWAFTCCRRAAHGLPAFAAPSYSDLADTMASVLPRLAVSVGFLALGAALLVDWGNRAAPSLIPAAALGAATVWLFPPALAAAVLAGPGAGWVPPWSVPAFASRLPVSLRPLRLATTALVLAAVARATVNPFEVLAGDTRLGTHILQTTALRFVLAVSLAILAALAGRLVFTHAEELGHGDPDSYRVPVFPEAEPRGRRPGC